MFGELQFRACKRLAAAGVTEMAKSSEREWKCTFSFRQPKSDVELNP